MAMELIETARVFPSTLMEGLVGYWRMEETSWDGTADEAVDSSGNGNHGTAQGGLTTISGGKLGRGSDMVGVNQYIDVTSTALASLTAFSLSAWAAFTGGTSRQPLWGFRTNTFVGFFVDWNVDNKPRLVLGATNLRVWTPTGVTLNDGEYHHYLLCSPGTGAQADVNDAVLWIDGILQAVSSTTATSVQTPRLNALIGRTKTEYLNGKMDEVAIYDRVITEQEVLVHYNSGAGRDLSGEMSFQLPLGLADTRATLEVEQL